MMSAAARDVFSRSAPAARPASAPRPRYGERMWMGKPLASYQDDELRGILAALKVTIFGEVVSAGPDRDQLLQRICEVDIKLDAIRALCRMRVHYEGRA